MKFLYNFNALTDTFPTKFDFHGKVYKQMPSCAQNWFTFTIMSTKREKPEKQEMNKIHEQIMNDT